MDSKIVQCFARYNLLVRPETLKFISRLNLAPNGLEDLCTGCMNLALATNIIEIQHLEQVMRLYQTHKVDQTLLQTLQHLLLNSITVVDPPAVPRDLPTAQHKIDMHLSRYERIKAGLVTQIMAIGSVIGRVGQQAVNLLGVLIQVENSYHLSDGTMHVKLRLPVASKSRGLVNVGQVVIVSGTWDEQENCFAASEISQPQTSPAASRSEGDMKLMLQEDSFGSFRKIHQLLEQMVTIDDLPLSRQRTLQYFPGHRDPTFTFWILSEFSMGNVNTLQNLMKLLNQTEQYKHSMTLPKAVFIVGPFVSSIKEMRANKPLAQEFCALFAKHQDLLGHVFFVASATDPHFAYALPHAPISLNLLLHSETHMHSLPNPARIDIFGVKVQIVQSDISREMRRHHILKTEINDIEDVCETAWAQRHLGCYAQQQIVYKWAHADQLQISDMTQLLVLADSTLPQFVHGQQPMTVNPGNFANKGEFLICTNDNEGLNVEKCKI